MLHIYQPIRFFKDFIEASVKYAYILSMRESEISCSLSLVWGKRKRLLSRGQKKRAGMKSSPQNNPDQNMSKKTNSIINSEIVNKV